MKIPELLAPVGSREALTAAVQNGADAVYLGGKMFSARQYANNFDNDELIEAIEYANVRDVRVYVTVNTLLSDTELPGAVKYLRFLYESGVDAIIVQDLGVAGLIRKLLPGLPIHASTQMTVHNSSGVQALKDCGFKRIVLARELSLGEIREISESTGVETEVFVHGALCISYSGQCLMSSMIGGRSGNRGRCAQPCRMEYTLVNNYGKTMADPETEGYHILSPKDLNMLRHIPDLVKSGVASLKIEGRMKRPEYVAIVTRIYRDALDRYRDNPDGFTVDDREIKDLAQIFNRGFTSGYFYGKQGREMMSYKRPNNRGLRLGRVTKNDRTKGMVEVMLEDSLTQGDGVEFWVTEGGRKGVVVNRIFLDGLQVEKALPGQKVLIPSEGRVRPGDRVFKTHDTELISTAEQSYKSSRELKKIPLRFDVGAEIGEVLVITASDNQGHTFTARGDSPAQEAMNKPLTYEYLHKQLDRLGNTPFAIGSLDVRITGNVMVPASEINETRRRAIEGIVELRGSKSREPVKANFSENAELILNASCETALTAKISLAMYAPKPELLKIAVDEGADTVYFGGSNLLREEKATLQELDSMLRYCRNNGTELVVSTPRIVRQSEMPRMMPLLKFALQNSLAVLAGNLGTLTEAIKIGIKDLYADYSLNIYNRQALNWLLEKYSITQASISPELTLDQISRITRKACIPLEAIVEGHLPLMVSDYCLQGSLLGKMAGDKDCRRACKSDGFAGIKDRLGLVFPLTNDEFCRSYVHNAKELSMIEDVCQLSKAGISRFRMEFSIESSDRTSKIIRSWRHELDRFNSDPKSYNPGPMVKENIAALSPAGLTKGHYYRGVE